MKELSLHILDITQNSIRAEAKRVSLMVIESSAENTLTIIIEDDGTGIRRTGFKPLRIPSSHPEPPEKLVWVYLCLRQQPSAVMAFSR